MTPSLSRRSCMLGIGGALALASVTRAASLSPGTLDESLLLAEGVPERYREIATYAVRTGSIMLVRQYGDRAEAEARRVAAIARDSFKPEPAMADIHACLAALPSPGAGTPELIAVLDRLAVARAALRAEAKALPLPELQARSEALDRKLRNRPDRRAVAALPPLMIAPALAVEAALAGRRLKLAIGFLFNGDLPKLRAAEPGNVEAEIDGALFQSRTTLSEPYGDPGLDEPLARDATIAIITGVLTGMSRGDIARLLAFYRDPAGRMRRTAVLDEYRRHADADARATILAALLQLKDRPVEDGAPR